MKLLYKIRTNRKKIIASVIVLTIITSLLYIVINAGSWLVVKDKLQPADAIVVLTGSTGDRMLQASDIYKKGYANKVLIVNPQTTARDILLERGVYLKSVAEISKDIGIELGIPEESITIIPGNATSTRDEAVKTALFLKENKDINKIILITSSYHTHRSYVTFKKSLSSLEKPVEILVIPSQYTDFNAKRWYTERESAKHVIMEYTRLFYFWIWERWRL